MVRIRVNVVESIIGGGEIINSSIFLLLSMVTVHLSEDPLSLC